MKINRESFEKMMGEDIKAMNQFRVEFEERGCLLEWSHIVGCLEKMVDREYGPKSVSGPKRPRYAEDEHLAFLDELRESGVTNMLGADRFLEEEFGFGKYEAQRVLAYWIDTFGKEGR